MREFSSSHHSRGLPFDASSRSGNLRPIRTRRGDNQPILQAWQSCPNPCRNRSSAMGDLSLCHEAGSKSPPSRDVGPLRNAQKFTAPRVMSSLVG